MKVFFYTFGCKVNSFETAAMAETLSASGFTPAKEPAGADVVVVNSCTVTAGGDKKTRNCLRRIRRENPDAVTVLTGCFPQAFPEAAAGIAEADIVTGNRRRGGIAELIFRYLSGRERVVDIAPHQKDDPFEHIAVHSIGGHTRAFLKVEDGCDRCCRYCIVPYARGHIRSLPTEEIRAQAESFAGAGYRETVLTGINLSSYGKDIGGDLADAASSVSAAEGIRRVRLSSLEPDLMTEAILDRLAENEKLCFQFHLALQSGSGNTLAAMGRRYTPEEYRAVAENIRARFRNPVFTTDVMVGFPGETEEDFLESLAFVRDFGFLKCHVFPYSPRPGTPAAKGPQLSRAVKEERAKRMAETAAASRRAILQEQVGRTAVVIPEKEENGWHTGYTDRYVPVQIRADGNFQTGDMVTVEITGTDGDICSASVRRQPGEDYSR